MIGTSRSEYLFIRLCIFFLHYLAPLSVLCCILLVLRNGFHSAATPFPLVIEIIAVAETLFYVLFYLPYSYHLQRESVHPPPPSREERKTLFERCRQTIDDPEEWLKTWFMGANVDDIRRDNVKEWFVWGFFNRDGPPGDDEEELDGYVDATERMLGRKLQPGKGKARSLRLTLDRVVMLHRSLTWYFCVGFVDFLTYIKLVCYGFHFHRTSLSQFFTLFPFRFQSLFTTYRSPAEHTTYWLRPHTSATKLPIVFIHGIGIGLYTYTNFFKELNSINAEDEQVGIVAIELMPVSFRITHPALGKRKLCNEIDQILLQHFPLDQKFVLVSHSYGTVITTILLKTPSIAKRIDSVVLVDPVSILLHLPDVAYNFTRRQPNKANEHQLYYFASMDFGVSHTLSRHFFWNESIMWKEDLGGRKLTACLAGKDLIVNTRAVAKYLLGDEVEANGRSSSVSVANGNGGRSLGLEEEDEQTQPLLSINEEGVDEDWKRLPWKGSGIDVIWFDDRDHAQVFDSAASRKRLISAVQAYCEGR